MPRRVQDIIPGNRRSVRDIPVKETAPSRASSRTTAKSKLKEREKEEEDVEEVKIHREKTPAKEPVQEIEEEQVVEKPKRRKKKHRFPWALSILGTVVVLAGVGFFISSHFANATFTLVPKTVPATINGTYVIPPASAGSFGYEIMTLSGSASTTVPASLGAYTETKAQGSVTVYNAYSAQAQKLVAGTRLSANSGLVYRLTSSIVVPGYTKSGVTVMPGSIKTTIVAEKAGADYDIGGSDVISDLKFIAYKGTAKYSGFYARLASDISGGFAGSKTVIAPNVLASSTADLQTALSAELERKLMNTLPDGYVMYPRMAVSSYGKPVVGQVSTSTSAGARLSIDATTYGIMFKKTDLARFLAGASSTAVFGQYGYTVPEIDGLSFIMTNQNNFSVAKKSNVTARISGSFELIGSIPVDSLRSSLSGAPLSQTQNILKKYGPVIDLSHSSAEINPPWVTTVPTDKNRVSMVIKSHNRSNL
jgi:hypothetical protein